MSLLRQIINTSGGAGSIFSATRAFSQPLKDVESVRWVCEPNYGFPMHAATGSPSGARAEDAEGQAQVRRVEAYQARLPQIEKHWDALFSRNGGINEEIPPKTKALKSMVRKYGLPPKYRPKVWMNYTGAHHKLLENEGYYESILREHVHPGKSAEIIEKDLLRSFPTHPYFSKGGEGLGKMRRVLRAYSYRNPLVSYCQSFNYIVGILLLHYEIEEQAFWMFVHIVETILPANYYNPKLKGIRTDGKVFHQLLKVYCPRIVDRFDSGPLELDVSNVFVTSWFLSLFVNVFPLATCLRIWDSFLLEGDKVLFRTGVAFFKIHQAKILQMKSRIDLIQFLNSAPAQVHEADQLMKSGFGLRLLSRTHVQVLRDKSTVEVNREVEALRRRQLARRKKRVSTFTRGFAPSVFKRGGEPELFARKTPSFRRRKKVEKDEKIRRQREPDVDPLLHQAFVEDQDDVESMQSPMTDKDFEDLEIAVRMIHAVVSIHLGSCMDIVRDLDREEEPHDVHEVESWAGKEGEGEIAQGDEPFQVLKEDSDDDGE